ncbi:uncharacterized protein [Leptinotarsa decemlineata]|uniref:uncharacterized protein n=1 Tax=Leptinotarsa decemlineata TaxID=7539 RepID=UPI003D30425C
MEKRNSKLDKIWRQYDSLIQEKKTLEDNLILVFNQIHVFVDHARKTGNPKDLNEILTLELKILKKLTEFSMDLERILEDKSVSISEILDNFHCIKNPIGNKTEPFNEKFELSEVKCEIEMPAQHSEHRLVDSPVECTTDIDESSATIIPFQFFELGCENEKHQNDIQNMKNCLDNVNAGLGLNQQSFSRVGDFYENSSIGLNKTNQSDLSQRVVPEEASCNTSKGAISVGFEIPERDTLISDILQSDPDNISCPESKNSRFNTITQTDEEIQDSAGGNSIFCNDSSVSVETKVSNITDTDCISSMRSQCKTQTNSDYKYSGNSRDQNQCSVRQFQNNESTALQKLNNYQSKKSNRDSMDIDQLPDISLKLVKTNRSISSKCVTSENNTHLKRQKKKENLESDVCKSSKQWPGSTVKLDTLYEPKRKRTPKVGDECAFSHIESPSEFYIHIDDEETSMIDSINEQSNEYFKGTVSSYCSKRAAVGDIGKFCFSYIPDYHGWFRVVVLDWCLNDTENVLIQLADYGNIRNTSYKNLRKMIKEISDIPLLAIRCHFPQMFPFGSTANNKLTDWPDVAIEALIGLSRNNENQNMFKVVYAEKKSQSVAIDLICTLDGSKDTVGQILMDMGIAVQIFEEHQL